MTITTVDACAPCAASLADLSSRTKLTDAKIQRHNTPSTS